jgi:DNA repair protein RadC
MDNPHENHRARMRKRYREKGIGAFAEHEVLELLLYYCYPRRDTNEIAHRMIKAFGSLHNLMDTDVKDIMERCGVSENIAVLLNMIPALAGFYFKGKWGRKVVLNAPEVAGTYAISLFVDATIERFYLLCLDTNYQLRHISLVTEGTTNETAVYPREIVKEALLHNADAVILAHNHPGGSLRPSQKDVEVTRKIIEGLEFIEIKVIDHIIAAGDRYYSFSAREQHVYGYKPFKSRNVYNNERR